MSQTSAQERPVRVGVFDSLEQADAAVANLFKAGFSRDQLMVVCSDVAIRDHFSDLPQELPSGSYTQNAVITGGSIGAGLGAFAAITSVMLTGGIVMLVTGGLALWAGGVVGGFVGAMMTRGVEKEVADFYDQALAEHKILVAAEVHGDHAEESLTKAERAFAEAGAQPVELPEG